MANIIGRRRESEILDRLFHSGKAELVAVYGRRRVGKTFLIREFFRGRLTVHHTGLSPRDSAGGGLKSTQLSLFASTLTSCGAELRKRPDDWFEAFDMLRDFLLTFDKNERLVVFLDEMPWMDTPRSGFLPAFEHFWNGWGAGQDNLMLIVCGSATSWVRSNLIGSYGGLYNRVTAEVALAPFTLREAEELLQQQGVMLRRYDIAQAYMAVGGIPYYLSLFSPGLSLPQIMDELFFARKARLLDEFDKLFSSVFSNPERYKKVVQLLAQRRAGFSRQDISEMTQIPSGADLTELLKTLEVSDFIQCYQPFGANKRQLLYRLTDPLCLFYLHFVYGQRRSYSFWQENANSPAINAWRGLAFEELCLSHSDSILAALGVRGTASQCSSWTMPPEDEAHGTQIDLIIVRADNVVNLCEMKFTVTTMW